MQQYDRCDFDSSLASGHVDLLKRSLLTEKSMEPNTSQVLKTSPIKVLLALLHVNFEEVLSLPIDEHTKFKLKILDTYFSQKFLIIHRINGEDKL